MSKSSQNFSADRREQNKNLKDFVLECSMGFVWNLESSCVSDG